MDAGVETLRRTDRSRGRGERYLAVFERGAALKDDPILNKGTCFTREEREALGLRGLLPPAVQTPEEQARARLRQLPRGRRRRRAATCSSPACRTATRRCSAGWSLDHLDEMVPIIYTPTVGKACEQYSHIYRRARGLYVSPHDRGRVAERAAQRRRATSRASSSSPTTRRSSASATRAWAACRSRSASSRSTPWAPASIRRTCLPIDLDVGTDNAGAARRSALPRRAAAAPARRARTSRCSTSWSRRSRGCFRARWSSGRTSRAATRSSVLERYRDACCRSTTTSRAPARWSWPGIRSGAAPGRARQLEDERVVFFGAGASGAGSALAVRAAHARGGRPARELSRRVALPRFEGPDPRRPARARRRQARDRGRSGAGRGLAARSAGRRFASPTSCGSFKPTVLVGASGQPGAFTEAIVRDMLRGCPRPIVLALSNPDQQDRSDAGGSDPLDRTARPSSAPAARSRRSSTTGRTHTIGQGNNVFIFPGVGLGATAVGARWLPDEAFVAAARALFEFTATSSRAGRSDLSAALRPA